MSHTNILLFFGCFLCGSSPYKVSHQDSKEIFVGSTPCDLQISSVLNLNKADSVDFIRWELLIHSNASNEFSLKINYGVSKPNTLGFIDGGKQKQFDGNLEFITSSQEAEIIALTSAELKAPLRLIRVSNSILHVLDGDKLMIGNGGWSYSLTRKNFKNEASHLLLSTMSGLDLDVIDNTLTFAGRTPCEPINAEYNLSLSDECLKIKWLIKLYIDPATRRPTSFYLNRTGHRSSRIEGTWSIKNEVFNNRNITICKLIPRSPFEPIEMLVADGNVLYFLDKKHSVMQGDENFSFVLNRKLN